MLIFFLYLLSGYTSTSTQVPTQITKRDILVAFQIIPQNTNNLHFISDSIFLNSVLVTIVYTYLLYQYSARSNRIKKKLSPQIVFTVKIYRLVHWSITLSHLQYV